MSGGDLLFQTSRGPARDDGVVMTSKQCALLWFIRLAGAAALLLPAGLAGAQQGALEKSVAGADAAAGKRYALRCKACHTLDKGGANRLGPNLWMVVGRKQAAVKGFNFSPAFRKLAGAWSLAELDAFLANPRKYAPGNRMAFAGAKSERQRHQLLSYLTSLSDTPRRTKPEVAAKPGAADGPSLADELGLPKGKGREDVAALCAACHSLSIVRQQGLDRDRWNELMTWMTEKQGMPAMESRQRKAVVDYLAQNFGPQSRRGRPNAMNPMMPSMPAMPLPMPK